MSNMWPMMNGFVRDYLAHHGELATQDVWVRKHAANKGWSVNPRWMVCTNLRLWLRAPWPWDTPIGHRITP